MSAIRTYEVFRVSSEDGRFQSLVRLLDADLAERDGDEHAFYAQYNGIEALRNAVVIEVEGAPVSCGAFKNFDDRTVEVKRMFTLPEFRGKGMAQRVLSELESWAKDEGNLRCVLETGLRQPEAIRFYSRAGYARIPNFPPYDGVGNSVCFEKLI